MTELATKPGETTLTDPQLTAEKAVPDPKLIIDGKEYDIPTIDSLDMDEARILYDYSGLVIEDFAPSDPEATDEEKQQDEDRRYHKGTHPGFKQSLIHIAYRRKHRDLGPARIKEVVGKMNLVDVTLMLAVPLADAEEADAGPPEIESDELSSTPSSERSTTGLSLSSGSDSPTTSDAPDETPESTGVSRSVTSSPHTPEPTSAS